MLISRVYIRSPDHLNVGSTQVAVGGLGGKVGLGGFGIESGTSDEGRAGPGGRTIGGAGFGSGFAGVFIIAPD